MFFDRDNFAIGDEIETLDDIVSSGVMDGLLGNRDTLPNGSRGVVSSLDYLCDPDEFSIEVGFSEHGIWWLRPQDLRNISKGNVVT